MDRTCFDSRLPESERVSATFATYKFQFFLLLFILYFQLQRALDVIWYMDEKGAATPAGTFDVGDDGKRTVVLAGEMGLGDSIGVTIEPAGGSDTPSDEVVLVEHGRATTGGSHAALLGAHPAYRAIVTRGEDQ